MGAGVLRKKVNEAGLKNISVTNSAINNLPDDVDLVITHRDLTERAMRHAPQAQHISLNNFLDSQLYSDLTARLVAVQKSGDNQQRVMTTLDDSFEDSEQNLFRLTADNVFLGQHADHIKSKRSVSPASSWSKAVMSSPNMYRQCWIAKN